MDRRFVILVASTLAIAGCQAVQTQRASSSFLEVAAQDEAAHAQLAAAASMIGESQQVRDLGAKLTSDHSKAKAETLALARTLGVSVSAEPEAADATKLADLQKLPGSKFDTAFVQHLASEYRRDIKLYGEQANAEAPEVAALVKARLPMLEDNLKATESLASKLSTNSAS